MFGLTTETRIVKKNKKTDETANVPMTQDEIVDTARRIVVGTGSIVAECVGVYMILDTARKILINRLSK